MCKFICNAFSLNMLAVLACVIRVKEVSVEDARTLAVGMPSAVGHADTANVFGEVLGTTVATARVTVSLVSGDSVLVGQYSGPRLPEGCKTLPAGASIKWAVVTIE